MRKPNFIHEMSRIHARSQSTLVLRIRRAMCINAIHAGSVDADPAKWVVTHGMLEREVAKVRKAEHSGEKNGPRRRIGVQPA